MNNNKYLNLEYAKKKKRSENKRFLICIIKLAIYVVDTSNLSNYSYYEAKEIPSLSDCNNIVIKLNTEKGYIIAISGTL